MYGRMADSGNPKPWRASIASCRRSVDMSSSFFGPSPAHPLSGAGNVTVSRVTPDCERHVAGCLGTCTDLPLPGPLPALVGPSGCALAVAFSLVCFFGGLSSSHERQVCFRMLWCGVQRDEHTHFVSGSSALSDAIAGRRFHGICCHDGVTAYLNWNLNGD